MPASSSSCCPWGARLWALVSQCLQLGVVYIGIGALVAIGLVAGLTPLRDQLGQAHRVMALDQQGNGLSPLFPLAAGPSPAPQAAPDAIEAASPLLASEELTWAENEGEDDEREAGSRIDLPELNFTRALVESGQQDSLPGVTAKQKKALRSYIARKYRIAGSVAGALIQTAFIVGGEMSLDPQLLLAVIAIESRYNPYAESHVGAQGLMQVMTRVHKEKFAEFGEGPLAAVHPLANMRVGAQILSDCIRRRGSLDGGLACYVGATGPGDGGYGAKVKAEWRRLALASGIAIPRQP